MPELPDVEIYRKEAEQCKGSVIENVLVSDERFVKVPEKDLNEILAGKKLINVRRLGKYLFLETGKGAAIILHFGMTGNLHCFGADEDIPRYTRCSILFKDRLRLDVLSRRKLGHIDYTSDTDAWIKSKQLGPDALEISKEKFVSLLKDRKSMLKTVLTDQNVISGIGNVYADEILFQARLHPRMQISQINAEEIGKLFNHMQTVLKTAIQKNADVSELPANYLLTSRTKNRKCPGCSGKVATIKISGRTTYFCPSCQKSS